jgi:hypothetical protein
MKLLALLLLGAVTYAGCTTPQQPKPAPEWHGFPIVPPIPDADPAVRHPVTLQVPTRIEVERTTETIAFSIDRSALEPADVTVGLQMLTGVTSEWFVYRVGESRPAEPFCSGLSGGVEFNLGTSFVNTKQRGIPVPGEQYVIEVDLAVFETDIPAQHFWSPHSEKYQVLWTRTLRQTVE